jgi:hypothetical protein
MTGFHAHGQAHAGQHYGVPAQSHYAAMVHHSGMPFARPLPMRAPVLAPAGFDHHNHQHQLAGHHQHGRAHNHAHSQPHAHAQHLAMADPYMPSDDEIAHLQKLSSEYEPEATVSVPLRLLPHPSLTLPGPASRRAPEQRRHCDAVCQRGPRLQSQDGRATCQIRLLPHLPRRRPLWMAG